MYIFLFAAVNQMNFIFLTLNYDSLIFLTIFLKILKISIDTLKIFFLNVFVVIQLEKCIPNLLAYKNIIIYIINLMMLHFWQLLK